jgi:hypothetical protein
MSGVASLSAVLAALTIPSAHFVSGARTYALAGLCVTRAFVLGGGEEDESSSSAFSSSSAMYAVAAFLLRSVADEVDTGTDAVVTVATVAAFEILWRIAGASWAGVGRADRLLAVHGAVFAAARWLRHAAPLLLHLHDANDDDAARATAAAAAAAAGPPVEPVHLIVQTLLGGCGLLVILLGPLVGVAAPSPASSSWAMRLPRWLPSAAYYVAALVVVGLEYVYLGALLPPTGAPRAAEAAGRLSLALGPLAPLLPPVHSEPFTWVAERVALVDAQTTACVTAWAATVLALVVLVPRPAGDAEGGGAVAAAPSPSGRGALLRTRKLFHFAALAMFAPAVILGSGALGPSGGSSGGSPLSLPPLQSPLLPLLHVALAVAFKVLLLLELARALRVWPAALPAAIDRHMRGYTDGRDAGALITTHLALLLGCALPVWMTPLDQPAAAAAAAAPAAAPAVAGQAGATLLLAAGPLALVAARLSGLLAVGVGDAVAAIVGTRAVDRGTAVRWGDRMRALHEAVFDDEEEEGEGKEGAGVAAADGSAPAPGTAAAPTAAAKGETKPAAVFSPATAAAAADWPGGEKTLQGTAAFALSFFAVAAVLLLAAAAVDAGAGPLASTVWTTTTTGGGGLLLTSAAPLLRLAAAVGAAAVAGALAETFVGESDNVLVPLLCWIVVREVGGRG